MKANWKIIGILSVIAAAILVLVIVTSGENLPADIDQTTEPNTLQEETQTREPVVHDIELRVHRAGFSPETITVREGDTLNLNIRATDGLNHGISIDSFNVREEIPATEAVQVSFVADSAGTFDYYTHVQSHTSYGQVRGTLTVNE